MLHCFTGGPDEVERCLRVGMYVSFSGIVTFKNAADVREAAARCPSTGCSSRRTVRSWRPCPIGAAPTSRRTCPLVGEAIAAVKGCGVDEIMERTAVAATIVFSTGD